MAANSSLYLQDLPLPSAGPRGGKTVTLTPVTSSGTPSGSANKTTQEVAAALAAMTQSLLLSMQKMIELLSEESQENAQTSQMNVSVASAQAQQTVDAEKAYQAQQSSFWHQFGAIMLKYVLGPVLATLTLAATIWFAGPAAFAIAAAVLIATMIPVHNGQGMLSSGVDAAVGAIGKDCGWSQGTIDIVQGVVNLIVGIAIGIATGFAASAATAVEVADSVVEGAATELESVSLTLESSVTTTLDDAGIVADDTVSSGQNVVKTAETTAEKAASYKYNVGKFTGINSAASVISSSNCFNDMTYGIASNAGASDNKSQEIASIVGMIMNLAVMVGSIGAGYSSMSSLAADSGECNPVFKIASKLFGEDSPLLKLLGTSSTIGKGISGMTMGQFQSFMVTAGVVTNGAAAGANGYNGWEQHKAAELQAAIFQYTGDLQFSQDTGSIISQMTTLANNSLKDALTKFYVLEKAPNYSQELFSEAKEMLQG